MVSVLTLFIVGYAFIVFEGYFKINKSATALALAFFTWLAYFIGSSAESVPIEEMSQSLGKTSEVIFFLLGAMTLVELVDSHKGFQVVSQHIRFRSKRMLLFAITMTTFFLSAVLDNVTTTILMVSILRKLIPLREQRLMPLCLVVIAANAGGAWTPIGDITTTMLWIDGDLSTIGVMQSLFFPSLVAVLVPLAFVLYSESGEYPPIPKIDEQKEPGALLVFSLGFLSFLLVPVIKALTGVPPFMGILFGLALLWIITDILHYSHTERQHLRVVSALTKIDVAGILFFLGILLSVASLDAVGALEKLSLFLSQNLNGYVPIATAIGLLSALVDNVPIVAASMGMYHLPIDHPFWTLVAYTAGTGGSLLLIGSSSGVALMGIEKIDFFEYAKRATFPAFLGFIAGIGVYLFRL